MKRCEFLKKCVFLDPLSNDQLAKLGGALEVSTYEDGDYIVKQGEVGDSFFIIESGAVKCTQIKSNGREVELITLNSGDYFGETGLISQAERNATISVLEEAKLLKLSKESLDELTEEYPALFEDLKQSAADRTG